MRERAWRGRNPNREAGECSTPWLDISAVIAAIPALTPLGEVRHGAEEAEPPGMVQREQPREEKPPEQLAEHTHRKQKAGRDEVHRLPLSAMPPPGTIMCTCGWWVIADPQVWSTSAGAQIDKIRTSKVD